MLTDTTPATASDTDEVPPLIVCSADQSDPWRCMSLDLGTRSYAGARLLCCREVPGVCDP